MTTTAPTGIDVPNFFTDRAPWTVFLLAGVPVRASLVAIDDVATEDKWTKQQSKETNDSTNTYGGTQRASFKLTFEATEDADFDDLRRVWKLLEPVGGQGGVGAPAASTGGQTWAVGSPARTDGGAGSTGSAGVVPAADTGGVGQNTGSETPADKVANGKRPPTVAVGYPSLAWHGITAASREKWVGPYITETNSLRVELTMIPQRPQTPAGAGAASTAAKTNGSQYGLGAAEGNPNAPTPSGKVNGAAKAEASGV